MAVFTFAMRAGVSTMTIISAKRNGRERRGIARNMEDVIDNKGLRIRQSVAEYLVPSGHQGIVKLEREQLASVSTFAQ